MGFQKGPEGRTEGCSEAGARWCACRALRGVEECAEGCTGVWRCGEEGVRREKRCRGVEKCNWVQGCMTSSVPSQLCAAVCENATGTTKTCQETQRVSTKRV